MDILMVASEAVPFAKTGGLADVVGSLSKELERLGHNLKVVLPYYRTVKEGNFEVDHLKETIKIGIADREVEGEVLTARMGRDITVYLIKNDDYYDREGLYGTENGDYGDNAERFTFFCKAALELPKMTGFKPDVIHCHDWQTGLIPVYLKTLFKSDSFYFPTRTVFTIHNLAYQGLFRSEDMPLTGLPWDVFTPEGIEFYGKINFLKAGIVYGDIINTVSKRYAQEILTEEFGYGLDGALRSRREDLYGILNGADYEEWNPENDEFIIRKYSREDPSGKRDCKRDIIKEFGLEIDDYTPVFGLVSRLAQQKGLDLVVDAAEEISRLGGLIILGKGDKDYERLVAGLGDRYPRRVGVKIGFDESLAHKITAGADFFLIPSQYEPCGLGAMYSLKYGTIPIVRATGGLDDIISEFNPRSGRGNGFKFPDLSGDSLISGIRTAMKGYRKEALWHKLMGNALACDYSWRRPAVEYEKLYRKALGRETVNKKSRAD